MSVMCSKVEAEVHAFSQVLEKFASRWHQLKPRDDLLEEGGERGGSALASLKERRAEFDELVATGEKLRCVGRWIFPLALTHICE